MSSIYDWSVKADKNANSDNIINWEHGQPPSSVNGSARSMMKRIAEYIQDLSGTIQALGDGNDISVSLVTEITKYQDGIRFYFRANKTNTKEATLKIGSLAALPIYQTNKTGLVKAEIGALQKDSLYEVIYISHLSDKGGWFLTNPTRSSEKANHIPTGTIIQYPHDDFSAEEWLVCNGDCVSKAKYANLYQVLGDRWGASTKGTDHFMIPDFRGVFLRGLDSGKGLDPGRTIGSFQESCNKAHSHSASCEEDGAHTHQMLAPLDGDGGDGLEYASPQYDNSPNPKAKYVDLDPSPIEKTGKHSHKVVVDSSGEKEARPVNYSILFLIKT